MGTCTSCRERRARTSLIPPASSSSIDNLSHSFHQNLLINRLTNLRTFSPYNLNTLIDETLLMIRTVIDTDQEPPHAMFLVSRIANREDRWLEVIMALIERIPTHDPLGATVIALLLDECSLPSQDLVQHLIRRACSNNRSRVKHLQSIIDEHVEEVSLRTRNAQLTITLTSAADQSSSQYHEEMTDAGRLAGSVSPTTAPEKSNKSSSSSVAAAAAAVSHSASKRGSVSLKTGHSSQHPPARKYDDDLRRERNTLVVLACLAEKLVGPTSTSMLTGLGLEFLVDRAYLGIHAYNQLESLQPDAPQSPTSKYTSILKIILFALLAIEKFSHTSESKYILLQSLTVNRDQNRSNLLEYYEPWAQSKNCFQRQIGFCAQWLLDNVFMLDHRRPTYETIDHRYINVILNDKDVSEYLKIGPDGLEARSDTVSFESVRCTYHVSSGVWYYEVLIVTDGVMQIGWATKQSKFMNHEGYGIGDDQHSIAYDGCRNLIWFGAKSIPHTNPAWKSGDILGCLIDFDRREVIFSLNGQALDPFRKLFSSSSSSSHVGSYFAAASFMSYQHCRFNFGSSPFHYPPTTVKTFQTFNQHGFLADDEKLILPKYKKLELLRAIDIKDTDCILCVDLPANIILKPCQHRGFCQVCAAKLDSCPICRSIIRERTLHTN